jgi:hypothetical protein
MIVVFVTTVLLKPKLTFGVITTAHIPYIRGLKIKLTGGPHSKDKILCGPQFKEEKA